MKPTSILIVDDNKNMRVLLRTILRPYGFTNVQEAEDGIEALEALKTAFFDLVIVDYAMPNLDGSEFAKLVRNSSDSHNKFIAIIMVTGHPTRQVLLRARDGGVDEILAKPVSAQMLQERLVSVIKHRREFVKTKSYFGPDRRRFRGLKMDLERLRRANDPAPEAVEATAMVKA